LIGVGGRLVASMAGINEKTSKKDEILTVRQLKKDIETSRPFQTG
jgi:hypothetical protein